MSRRSSVASAADTAPRRRSRPARFPSAALDEVSSSRPLCASCRSSVCPDRSAHRVLADLTVGEHAAIVQQRPTDPVDLVHAATHPAAVAMGSGQPRQPCATTTTRAGPSRPRSLEAKSAKARSERKGACVAQQFAPGRPSLLQDLIDVDAALDDSPHGDPLPEAASKSRPSHLAPPDRRSIRQQGRSVKS